MLLPFVIYFKFNHGLYELVQGTFIHNIKLMLVDMDSFSLAIRKIIKSIPIILFIVSGVFVIICQKKALGNLMIIVGCFEVLFSITGKGYWYLYLPIVCCLPLLIAIFLEILKGKARLISVVICSICMIGIYSIPLIHYIEYLTTEDLSGYESMINDLCNYQTNVENKDVFLVDIPAFVYLEADVIPEYRYSFLQSEYEGIIPGIRDELNEYVLNSCESAILIVRSTGWMYEHMGNYSMCDVYYHGRQMMAVYEYISEVE